MLKLKEKVGEKKEERRKMSTNIMKRRRRMVKSERWKKEMQAMVATFVIYAFFSFIYHMEDIEFSI